ncbi:GIN domain-containing protein [Noviherbaspirillum galbum]|uniref:DUF2807 domain-containing protein n=1 Tax=Noviherbaspirillum galbum TaxID=2709383 RepID=A0A6B3STR8_9BURK|nr:DUF2807 domain-containing protein [Noviherbaspirillum galbum]NEX64001.1 DUF2807 domain-containing protein [Noviherbaspirillum galbum]
MRTRVSAVALAICAVLASVAAIEAHAQGTTPQESNSGTAVSENRSVPASVTMVEVRGNIDLRMRQAAAPAMVMRYQPRLKPKVTLSQDGTRLLIETEKESWTLGRAATPVVELNLPALRELGISGSGDADVRGFKGESLQLSLAGSGNAKFEGQYREVTVSVSGSGNLKMDAGASDNLEFSLAGSGEATVTGSGKSLALNIAGSGAFNGKQLKVASARITSAGSGSASVNAASAIAVSSVGSGDVSVYGNPAQRSVSRVGSGSVRWQ